MAELTKTGIDGLDSILNGGIGRNAAVLVSGNPGTGKSILGIQFIYNGVQQFDERGVYLSFEENAVDISQAATSIGFEQWDEYVDRGDVLVYDKRDLLDENGFASTIDRLLEDLGDADYDRLVLDSLTMFELFFDSEQEKRTYLLKFIDILKDNGITSLLITEQGTMFPDADIGLENFLTDGNIYMIQLPKESGVNRYIWVAKMRKQDIETDIFPLRISTGGITVHEQAAAFSMMNSGEDSEFY